MVNVTLFFFWRELWRKKNSACIERGEIVLSVRELHLNAGLLGDEGW